MEKPWHQTLGKISNGIYILTTCHKNEINGMIISWVSPISYEPPLIMVAVHPNRHSHHLVEQSGCFALNIISQNQPALLECFKKPVPGDKFNSIQWDKGTTGCPILKDCVAYVECTVKESLKPGNHTLFLGEVKDAQVFSDDEPMTTRDYSGIYLGKN